MDNEKEKNGRGGIKIALIIAAIIVLIIILALLLSKCGGAPEEPGSPSPSENGGEPRTDTGDQTPEGVHVHAFGAWTVLTQPTCTLPGEHQRTCTSCGYAEKEDMSPLGHDGHNNVCVTCGKKAVEPEKLSYSSYPYGDGLWITRADGFTDTDVLIPDVIGGEPVVCIAASAFEGNETIVSLSLPDSVTQLGSFIFYHCPSLRMIRFGKNIGNQHTV
ncbi:MAG: leucine-rich repeat protein, partial [Oscillospiraceae bacterium]|nr:leucine-rich repeat protein [Oscillospiraceae bacterium]